MKTVTMDAELLEMATQHLQELNCKLLARWSHGCEVAATSEYR